MTASQDSDTDRLLEQAAQGDLGARQQLLVRHQKRLERMIALRMDRRLAARLDPADVVQDTLADAVEQMSEYLCRRPLPFYPWLRQLAWDRLADLHRRHIRAQRRSVMREERWTPDLPDESILELAGRLLAGGSSPSARLQREEQRDRVRAALARLPDNDREVLVLRHLEMLSSREIAAILGITEGAVNTRHVRALERLRGYLADALTEDQP
jgi:RNA polymerase sigma-70 factor (ECF subfamily)